MKGNNVKKRIIIGFKTRANRPLFALFLLRLRVSTSPLRRLVILPLAVLLIASGCATLTTASHFTKDSPKFYSGTRLNIHASNHDEDILRAYKEKYGVDPPTHPKTDLAFSFLGDTLILFPVVIPVVLYEAVFD